MSLARQQGPGLRFPLTLVVYFTFCNQARIPLGQRETAARWGGRLLDARNSWAAQRLRVIAVAAVAIEPVGIVIDIVIVAVVRGLIEQAGARPVIVTVASAR